MEIMWFAGTVAALSTFGIKTGIGLSSRIYDSSRTTRKRLLFLFLILGVYAIFFTAGALLLDILEWTGNSGVFFSFLESGALFHALTAAGLILWGGWLLFKKDRHSEKGNSDIPALLLILPCPVCALSLLLILAFSKTLFENWNFFVMPLLFTVLFSGIVLLTTAVFFFFRKKISSAGNTFTGAAMFFVGMYFLLLMLAGPNFEKILSVYSMALKNAGQFTLITPAFASTLLITVLIFCTGIIFEILRQNKNRNREE